MNGIIVGFFENAKVIFVVEKRSIASIFQLRRARRGMKTVNYGYQLFSHYGILERNRCQWALSLESTHFLSIMKCLR